ncbi:MAG: MFS transporter [Actinomycetales bacterium]
MSRMLASLQIRNYRLYAGGALVSNIGTWMQRVAQDWLVLTILTDHDAVAVGVTTGLQFAPILLLSPVSGLLADRLPKRRLMIATQSAMGITALILGVLVITGAVQLWHVFALATALGVFSALDAPARQTFVTEMVPTELVPNAVALNSASFHAGRLIGPGLAGLAIAAFSTGPVFLLNAASFSGTLAALLAMRPGELRQSERAPRARGQIRDGLRYVRGRPDILVILAIIGTIGTFGMNFQLTTALMATAVYGKGVTGYGLLGSVMAVGSLAGALLAARRRHPGMRLLLGAVAAFGVFSCLAAVMPTYLSFAVMLAPVGLASLTVMTAANTIVQLTTDQAMRGRVIALYMAVFAGGTPIGAPLIGWVGEVFGARWTIAVGGVTALAAAGIAALVLLRLQHRSLRVRWWPRPRVRLIPDRRSVGEPSRAAPPEQDADVAAVPTRPVVATPVVATPVVAAPAGAKAGACTCDPGALRAGESPRQ